MKNSNIYINYPINKLAIPSKRLKKLKDNNIINLYENTLKNRPFIIKFKEGEIVLHKKQSLNLIFKVIRVKNGSNETIGTAFPIVNDNYAITACHVLKQCLEYKYFLESYDGCVRIDDLEHYCSVYNPEYYIDISIIKLNKNLNNFNKYISICNDCIKLLELNIIHMDIQN